MILFGSKWGGFSKTEFFSGSITRSSPRSLKIFLPKIIPSSYRSRVEVGGKQQTEERGARKAERRPQQMRLRGRQGNVPTLTSILGRLRRASLSSVLQDASRCSEMWWPSAGHVF